MSTQEISDEKYVRGLLAKIYKISKYAKNSRFITFIKVPLSVTYVTKNVHKYLKLFN